MCLEDDIEYAYVGDDAPLWTCKFAMIGTKSCAYCLCYACHLAKGDSRRGKRRKLNTNSNEDECDHEALSPFTDSAYFDPKYKEQCKKENKHFSSKCAKCFKTLTGVRNYMNV